MTAQPAEPTPAAPVAPAAPATPPEPSTAVTTPTAPAPPEPAPASDPAPTANPWADPAAAKAEIERLRRENGSARTNAKAQAAEDARKELAASIGKILDPDADPVDPATLTQNLTVAQADAKQARVALAVYQNAGTAGGDPVALLDSTTFLTSVASIDPTDPAAVSAAITAAVAANPRLGAAPGTPPEPRTPAPNPAQGASGSGVGPDLAAQIAEAQAKGDWQTVVALETRKLATAPKP